jgi:glycosyltransferase involved in cell wall biosynthesis
MKVLMVGVDEKAVGGMWTVVENYLNSKKFCNDTNLKYIPTATSSSIIGKLLFSGNAIIKLILTLIFKKIDIVHVHMAERGSVFREGIVVLLSKLFRAKVIIHMHGATFETWYDNQNKLIKKVISYILNSCDTFLILGEFFRPFIRNIIKNESKIKVLYNAVNIPTENKYQTNSNEIIFLGMLIERKGINDFLKSISYIKDKIPSDIKIKLYGADKYNNIESKIDDYGLTSIVNYCGWLKNQEKSECFSKAMMNILPSYSEGLPMTVLETMSYGIPNISTFVAGVPEAIENNHDGILIKPGDIKELSKSILMLIKNPELRCEYSKNSYNHVKDQFSVEKHINKLECVYKEILCR